eukprot:CAMPEP_0181085034 /NCGR_PEP_ID=MMETSP1071-20121207/5014_1 /TAXON_ID=35127 /ORGANISM="Thalassiosira sp., Strain NH16" /LENGTH=72 /DNA_ID=CAMNT_0023166809 /DNA_START=62 /DNA_END=276 /DNA_ORIENTATION=+
MAYQSISVDNHHDDEDAGLVLGGHYPNANEIGDSHNRRVPNRRRRLVYAAVLVALALITADLIAADWARLRL